MPKRKSADSDSDLCQLLLQKRQEAEPSDKSENQAGPELLRLLPRPRPPADDECTQEGPQLIALLGRGRRAASRSQSAASASTSQSKAAGPRQEGPDLLRLLAEESTRNENTCEGSDLLSVLRGESSAPAADTPCGPDTDASEDDDGDGREDTSFDIGWEKMQKFAQIQFWEKQAQNDEIPKPKRAYNMVNRNPRDAKCSSRLSKTTVFQLHGLLDCWAQAVNVPGLHYDSLSLSASLPRSHARSLPPCLAPSLSLSPPSLPPLPPRAGVCSSARS